MLNNLKSNYIVINVIQIALTLIGLLPWVIYAYTINIGLSSLIDEGQMQLLLNRPKPEGHLGSQSGVIVDRFLINYGYTAITLLWARFIIQSVAVVSLLITSYFYIHNHLKININSYAYVGFFLLVTSFSLYLFTKTISYNHVQQLCVLLTVSAYLVFLTYESSILTRNISLFCIGFIAVFSILNILPSGLTLTSLIAIFLLAHVYPSRKALAVVLIYLTLGLVFGLIVFNHYFKCLQLLYSELHNISVRVSQLNRAYDLASLLFKLLRSLLTLVVVAISVVGLLHIFDIYYDRSNRKYYPYLISIALFVALHIYFHKYTFKAQLGLAQWSIAPTIALVFSYFKKEQYIRSTLRELLSLIFLLIIPVFASLGTNLNITDKFFYFIGTWVIVCVILARVVEKKYAYFSFSLFLSISILVHLQSFSWYWNEYKDATVQSHSLKRLSGIYITKVQKNHFEQLQQTLFNHGFKEGDTIMAFQPDLMSVFAVGGSAGKQVFFVPNDFLTNNIYSLKRPKFIILNEYSYSQVYNRIQAWGFDDNYTMIKIGTPETINYFDANKSRMLFCLKPESKI